MAVRSWALPFLFCVLSASNAHAQDKDELARRHFESGAAYFAEAEYEEALRAFEKAYELSERAQILLNIAVVQERLGNLAGAVAALDQYMAVNPSDPELETIRLRRDNLQKRAESQSSEAVAPQAPAVSAPPPPPATPAPQVADEPRKSEPNLLPAYLTLSVGALAGVGALITGLGAQAEYDELEDTCSPGCDSNDTSTGESLALTSTVLSGVALVGIGVGTYLWLSADEGEQAAHEPARVLVGLGPAGGYAQARWRF